ncbi:uncharacterized protein LOC144086714 isoform X2 [Stigmatopora argus]
MATANQSFEGGRDEATSLLCLPPISLSLPLSLPRASGRSRAVRVAVSGGGSSWRSLRLSTSIGGSVRTTSRPAHRRDDVARGRRYRKSVGRRRHAPPRLDVVPSAPATSLRRLPVAQGHSARPEVRRRAGGGGAPARRSAPAPGDHPSRRLRALPAEPKDAVAAHPPPAPRLQDRLRGRPPGERRRGRGPPSLRPLRPHRGAPHEQEEFLPRSIRRGVHGGPGAPPLRLPSSGGRRRGQKRPRQDPRGLRPGARRRVRVGVQTKALGRPKRRRAPGRRAALLRGPERRARLGPGGDGGAPLPAGWRPGDARRRQPDLRPDAERPRARQTTALGRRAGTPDAAASARRLRPRAGRHPLAARPATRPRKFDGAATGTTTIWVPAVKRSRRGPRGRRTLSTGRRNPPGRPRRGPRIRRRSFRCSSGCGACGTSWRPRRRS